MLGFHISPLRGWLYPDSMTVEVKFSNSEPQMRK